MSHIGREIRRAREARSLNQAQLAVLIGTGPAAISRIENGKQSPNSNTLLKLAQALEVEVADFFPKAQSPLPLDDEDAIVSMERSGREFLTRVSSEDDRLWFIQKAVDILRHYHTLGQMVLSHMRDYTAWHGSSYVWTAFYDEGLAVAMDRDGVRDYAGWVKSGGRATSHQEASACDKLIEYDSAMQDLIAGMRAVDAETNARVKEDLERGIPEIDEFLATTPEGAPREP